jgi:transposase-like protein
LRQEVVRAFRNGQSLRVVAQRFGVSVSFVYRWVQRAGVQRLDRVDLTDHRTTKRKTPNRTNPKVERCVIQLRKNLKDKSVLGEHGALAIRREMESMDCPVIPALRTINLILKRNGCVDGKKRVRYKSPALGWYLPDVMNGIAELDSYDYVEDLRLAGKNGLVHIFNGISLHGGLVCSFPMVQMTAENTVFSLLQHWKQFGYPTYAQFDNSTVFTGPRHPNSIGNVIRLCLSLGVTPVLAPPRETGFQATIERYNGLWQKGVWERFHFKNHQQLIEQSEK